MAWTNIANANLQVGAPLRSVDILALRDNIPAVMNGDTGAPKIKAAAFEGQSGAAPVFAARAWVNFNGTGTVAIRASGNVSSITDNGVGDYTVNFTTALPDANYSLVSASGQNPSIGPLPVGFQSVTAPTASAARVECGVFSVNARTDSQYVTLSFFR